MGESLLQEGEVREGGGKGEREITRLLKKREKNPQVQRRFNYSVFQGKEPHTLGENSGKEWSSREEDPKQEVRVSHYEERPCHIRFGEERKATSGTGKL